MREAAAAREEYLAMQRRWDIVYSKAPVPGDLAEAITGIPGECELWSLYPAVAKSYAELR